MRYLASSGYARKSGFVLAALGSALFMVLGVGRFGNSDAVAYPTAETTATDNSGPSKFLPAPNPVPLCDSQEYFGSWLKNVEFAGTAVENRETVMQDFALTNDEQAAQLAQGVDVTGLYATFDTVTTSASNPNYPVSPEVAGGANSSIGIVMYEPATADVTLSEPVFYSQWVFTDLDRPAEGFEVTPVWIDPTVSQLGVYTATPEWDFGSSSANLADFNSTKTSTLDGFNIEGRAQVDFWGPISGFRILRTGAGGSGFTGGAGCAPLGLAKTAADPVWDPATNSFVVDYTVLVDNNLPSTETLASMIAAARAAAGNSYVSGDPQGIDIINMQLEDMLELDGFSAATVSNLASDIFTVNPNFDGVNDIALVTGTDTLTADTTGTVTFSVTYTPDFTDSTWSGCAASVANQAKGSGTAAGITVTDESDSGPDPGPAAVNVTGSGTDDPTPVDFALSCAIALDKSVTDGPTHNGDGTYNVEYSLVAQNAGTAPLTDVVIDDDLEATFGPAFVSSSVVSDTCVGATVIANATCEKVLDVVIEPTETFEWQNTGTVRGVAPGGDPVIDDSDAGTSVVESPAIALDKTATSGPDSNSDGTYTVEYTLTPQNIGNTVLRNITVTDDLSAVYGDYLVSSTIVSDTCAGASLNASVPPGAGDTCAQVISVVFAPGANLGPYDNTAAVTGMSPGGVQVSATSDESVTAPPTTPEIDLVKSVKTGELEVGVLVNYTFEVTNVGDVDLADVALDDALIADETCPKTTLAAGESMTCTGTYTITQADVDAGRVVNTATVTGTSPSGDQVTDTDDATYPVEQEPELTVDKQPAVGTIEVGNEISYPITVTNTGNTTLTSLTLVDSITTDVSCDVDQLAPGESAECVALYTVTQADVDACEIVNVATAAAARPDGSTVTSDDTATTPTNCTPGISVSKKAIDPRSVNVGETVQYEIDVTNTGTTTLKDVKIDDPLTTDEVCPLDMLAPGQMMICFASYVVTQADVDAGIITNMVTATGVDPNGQTVKDIDDEKVPSEHVPSLHIDKQAPKGPLSPGGTLTYPIVVTNNGTVTLSKLVVTDSLSTNVVCDKTELAPGEVANCTATYVVTANDVMAGQIINTATANAVDPDGTVLTDQDNEIVVLPRPEIVKPTPVPPKPPIKPPPPVKPKPPEKPKLALTGANPKPLAFTATGMVMMGVFLVAAGGRKPEDGRGSS